MLRGDYLAESQVLKAAVACWRLKTHSDQYAGRQIKHMAMLAKIGRVSTWHGRQ